MNLSLEPVSGGRQLDAFIKLPWRLYRDDPQWVPPLLFDRKQQLSPSQPFFEHAVWQGWVAFADGEPVGRISAQIDRLNDACGRPGLGYFGMLEAIDDQAVFDALFRQAESWLAAQGKRQVAGPFNLSINQEVGILVEGFDTPPYFMMTHSRPYYGPRIERSGYSPAKDLLAYELVLDFDAPPVMQAMIRRTAGRMRIRPLDGSRVKEDLLALCGIFNDAWAHNWNFVPFTEKEFLTVGKEMLMVIDKSLFQIAEVDGVPAAFIVMLPNLNEAMRDLNGRLLPLGWAKLLWRLKVKHPRTARVPLMGVRQAYQHTRLGPGLAFGVIDAVRKCGLEKGIELAELSWILEDNAGMRNIIETIGGKVTKRYRMYEKTLA